MEPPTDIERNQKFSDLEINILNREIIQGSNSTPLKKNKIILGLSVQHLTSKFNRVGEMNEVKKQ